MRDLDTISFSFDEGCPAMLMLLDLSAGFDTNSHSIIVQRLSEIGVVGKALGWFQNFLSNCTQTGNLGPFKSRVMPLDKGVLLGSSLSPTLFKVYAAPLAQAVRSCALDVISYTDDTQLIISVGPNPESTKPKLRECMSKIASWMSQNCLQLNGDNTEIVLFGKAHNYW